jgi:hypothetical protein
MTLDFTLDKYAQLCETMQQLDYHIVTMRDFLTGKQLEGVSIVLRHDVDRRIDAALRMATLESEYGISATYYVRARPSVFKPDALRKLHKLSHEVGYHYEVLAKMKGNFTKAIYCFEQDLKMFREVVPVSTISMHGSPLSPWNNLDLWQRYDFEDYGVIGEAVLSINGKKIYYFTDTGRSWGANRDNLRDYVASDDSPHQILDTEDLINFLEERPDHPVYISAHPNRWAFNWLTWSVSIASDWIINRAKRVVSLTRSLRNW